MRFKESYVSKLTPYSYVVQPLEWSLSQVSDKVVMVNC